MMQNKPCMKNVDKPIYNMMKKNSACLSYK
uniref:Uncharacterized protein n=1 Tax=Rhizophora mucronata TaxID=61149 RepID=A0A2P2QXL7_RHIMU